jgi:hypothetical protein
MCFKPFFLSVFAIIFVIGCKTVQEEETEPTPVARAFDRILTWETLGDVIPNNATAEDSAQLAERYVNTWLKEQVVLHHTELHLTEEQKKFDKEIEDFRKSLLTYAYESQLVTQRMDTAVSQEEMKAYYDGNLEIFALKDYIVKVKYCILDTETSKITKFRKLFNSTDPEDLVKLEQFCVDNGAAYYLSLDNWRYFEEILQDVPLQVYNVESFLKKNKSIEFEQENRLYFLSVLDYQLKDDVSPISLVEDQIRNLILNRRKMELLNKMRDDLYQDALNKGAILKNYE